MKTLIQKAQNFKLLAPAGDWASLRAGVQAGADYIYFGIREFNMRNTASKNFSISDIPKISKYCLENDIKSYLTLNTVMLDSDLKKMKEILKKAKDFNCHGIIASDLSVINYANSLKIPVCISTQMSVSNFEAVKYFSKYADRIILARELTLKQIKYIAKKIKGENITGPSNNLIEIEIFGHGALCVGISGRCNMSLYCYGTSANKGECTQVCRRAYKVEDLETGKKLVLRNKYIMSPKDLCTIGMLPEIINSGVSVLKLEGRGRPPEYVDTVVRSYRTALNSIIEDKYNIDLIKKLNSDLETVFNRGLGTGMYMGRNIDEWAKGPGNQSKEKRVFVGKVINFFKNKKIALIKIQANINLKEGEECLVIGDKTGLVRFKLKGCLIDNKVMKNLKQNDEWTIKLDKIARKNDQVYCLRR